MFNICKKKTIKSLHPDLNNMAVICRGMLRILDDFSAVNSEYRRLVFEWIIKARETFPNFILLKIIFNLKTL